jgi:hypothetical protein
MGVNHFLFLSGMPNHNPQPIIWASNPFSLGMLDMTLHLPSSILSSLLTGEIDRPSTGRVEPVRGCLITQAVWNGPP